jgi:hypothetical protein
MGYRYRPLGWGCFGVWVEGLGMVVNPEELKGPIAQMLEGLVVLRDSL